MPIKVNATRMELLKLKNRARMARRGHKLLKDKRDELMKEFLKLMRRNRQLRERAEAELARAYRHFLLAEGTGSCAGVETALALAAREVRVSAGFGHIMNVVVPSFELEEPVTPPLLGAVHASGDLEAAVRAFAEAVGLLTELAQVERAVELLADEIEKTRRRVNALEYVLIPQLDAAVKEIGMKLGEMERANVTRLMKIKDIVRAH